jgi:bacillithiol system protein YtxJ
LFPFSKPKPIRSDWLSLNNAEQLKTLFTQAGSSGPNIAVIFKHSTRCSISRMVLSRLEEKWAVDPSEVPFYYLDLIAYRQLSDEIASHLGVRHESPQLLIIRNNTCLYNKTHTSISAEDAQHFLENLKSQ